jgi:hypothetical protein
MRILVADEISNRTNTFELAMFIQRADVDYLDLGLLKMANTRVVPTPWKEVAERIRQGTYAAAFIAKPVRLWNPRKALWRNAWWLARHTTHGTLAFRLRALLSHLSAARVPIAGVDTSDAPIIDNSRFPVLAASRVFFKRELPTNPANSFLYTNDRTEDTGNIMRIPFFRRSVAKLRPLSLGIEDSRFAELAAYQPKKDIDVFFAGALQIVPLARSAYANSIVLRKRECAWWLRTFSSRKWSISTWRRGHWSAGVQRGTALIASAPTKSQRWAVCLCSSLRRLSRMHPSREM